jgi:hypothetical protein
MTASDCCTREGESEEPTPGYAMTASDCCTREGESEEPTPGYAMTAGDCCTREGESEEPTPGYAMTAGECCTQTQGKVSHRNNSSAQNNSSHPQAMLIPLQSESFVTNTFV